MSIPLISVILPFYNAEPTLDRAINSIIQQDFPHWELILVDNNSTDKSSAIANLYAQHDSRIRVIQEKQQGVAFAFNTGLTRTRGKYIARMDADDYCYPQRLHQQMTYLDNHPDADAVSGLVLYKAEVPQEGMRHYVEWTNTLLSSRQMADSRFIELTTINPTLMFRRQSLVKYGSYQEGNFPEDYELVLRWLSQGATISKVNSIVLDWHDSLRRLTRTDSRYSTDAFYQVKSRYLALWLRQNNPFHPAVVIWGGGRKTRQRAKRLEAYGIEIKAFIDILPTKVRDQPCIYYQEIAPPGQYFILSYVGNRGKREEIKQFLVNKGYRKTIHFLLIA